MPHRDPETGQFLPGHGREWDDIEVASFQAQVHVQAADLAGATGIGGEDNVFDGLELIDYDEIVDRNEELRLLTAHHHMVVYANSTETADGTVHGYLEISAQPTPGMVFDVRTANIQGDVDGASLSDDSIDLIGRPLTAMAGAPFSDGTTGVGGGGSEGSDETLVANPPGEFGRFHPRDELFANGVFTSWNIDDAGIHMDIAGQHVYGVLSD